MAIERNRKQNRKSISINGALYARFKAHAESVGEPMSDLLEPRLLAMLARAELEVRCDA